MMSQVYRYQAMSLVTWLMAEWETAERMEVIVITIGIVLACLLVAGIFLGGYMTAKVQALLDKLAATEKVLDSAIVAIGAHADGATPEELAKLTEAAGAVSTKSDSLAAEIAATNPPALPIIMPTGMVLVFFG